MSRGGQAFQASFCSLLGIEDVLRTTVRWLIRPRITSETLLLSEMPCLSLLSMNGAVASGARTGELGRLVHGAAGLGLGVFMAVPSLPHSQLVEASPQTADATGQAFSLTSAFSPPFI